MLLLFAANDVIVIVAVDVVSVPLLLLLLLSNIYYFQVGRLLGRSDIIVVICCFCICHEWLPSISVLLVPSITVPPLPAF